MEDSNRALLQDVLDMFLSCFYLCPTSVVCVKRLHSEHSSGHGPRRLHDHIVSQMPEVCRVHDRKLSRVDAHFVTRSGQALRLNYHPIIMTTSRSQAAASP